MDASLRTPDVLVVGGGATGAGLLRDLSRRGLRCLLVDKADFGTGTSGRYHGLLHSGGRYVVSDSATARECSAENRVLRRIAPGCIEDTGGLFVATPDDPDDYVQRFPGACLAADVPCEEIPVRDALAREPALNPAIRRVFRVLDGSLDPWQLIDANLAEGLARGSEAWPYHRVAAMERHGARIVAVTLADTLTGTTTIVRPGVVVSAAGAWSGQIAALAGVTVAMSPGKGTMLVYNQRMTDTVVNRCHHPADGDIMVPVHLVAILGTTDVRVDDPDRLEIGRDEVEHLVREGEKLFPDLRELRLLRAYAGARPLYQRSDLAASDTRQLSRGHAVIDHDRRDGVENFVSIVGGKLCTYRLMAEQTADVVCAKLGVGEPCTTADEPLPGQDPGRYHWLGARLAEHESAGGGDAALICECELVTRPMLDAFLDRRGTSSLDDIRRGTRLGMGPCQGGFCTFRAAAILAERMSRNGADAATLDRAAELADRALVAFLRERFKGVAPVAWGTQLQESWFVNGLYLGVLGADALPAARGDEGSADAKR
jgi:glycerol-3-phosphate dehydrogenase